MSRRLSFTKNALGRLNYVLLSCTLLACVSSHETQAAIPDAPPFTKNYQRVWAQDFTTMTNLDQLGVRATSLGTGTWIAHTPSNKDWFTFANPTANYHPFGVGDGYLTIRVQKDGHDPNNWFAGYSGGLLSSLDGAGKGFAQQYGYFECSMWTPGTPNTWPAFWLLDAPSVTNNKLNAAEIDVTESYGNYGAGPGQKPPGDPNVNTMTWHLWGNNGNPTSANGSSVKRPGMTTGFHTYGVDLEPTGITWYFDRQKVWWAPIFSEAQRPMFVLLNLALGGGNHNNAKGDNYDWNLTPNPTDLKVQYVAVWASPASPNYTGPAVVPTALKATPGNRVVALTWTPALGAESYTIYRNSKIIATGITTTSYTDRNLTNGSRYTYSIATVSRQGTSPASSAASATPKFGPPLDPADLRATQGNNQISLAWTASPDAASYNVYRGTETGGETAKPLATGITTTSYADKTVPNGQPAFYTVAAVSVGGISRLTNEVNAIPALDAETVAVAYAAQAPPIDGKKDAIWSNATVYPISRLGLGAPTPTNGVFQVMWDTANLYVLFTVNDSSPVKGTPDYNGDATEIYIDAKNTKATSYDATDFRYTLGYGHTSITEYAHSATTGVRFAQSTYRGGYRQEIQIPWTTLQVTPFAGMSLGLDAAINEAATLEQGRTAALFWRNTNATAYQNPSLFGNATLQPNAPPIVLPNGSYKIMNVKSGKALDVPGASLANVALDQMPYAGGQNQQWLVTSLGGGSYSIANVKSRSVVDCSPSFDNGHPVVQWPINGTPSATQRFTITRLSGHYLLTNVYSGRALDVAGGATGDGAAIIQSVCTATGSQLWDLVPLQ